MQAYYLTILVLSLKLKNKSWILSIIVNLIIRLEINLSTVILVLFSWGKLLKGKWELHLMTM